VLLSCANTGKKIVVNKTSNSDVFMRANYFIVNILKMLNDF